MTQSQSVAWTHWFLVLMPVVLGVSAWIVLEGAEADQRSALVVLRIALGRHVFAGDELPTLKIQMIAQIFFPGVLDRRLEGQDGHLFPAHVLSQLIGGKRLAKAHLAISVTI